MMKNYLLACKGALQARLLLVLGDRLHFVDSFDMYSVQDLIDLKNGVLLDWTHDVHETLAKHIKEDCLVSPNSSLFDKMSSNFCFINFFHFRAFIFVNCCQRLLYFRYVGDKAICVNYVTRKATLCSRLTKVLPCVQLAAQFFTVIVT